MTRPRKPEPEGFAEFWELWRPKARSTDGRGDARKTFAQHVKDGVDPQDIVLGAAWFLRNFKEWAYIPLASTWINRCSYEDLAPKERAYQEQRAKAKQHPVERFAARIPDKPPQPELTDEQRQRAREYIDRLNKKMNISGEFSQ